MYSFLSKNGQTIAFLTGVLTVAIFLILALSGNTSDLTSDAFLGLEQEELSAKLAPVNNFDFGFSATKALLLIGFVLALVMPLIYLVMNFSRKDLVSIGAVVAIIVIFLVFKNISAGEVDSYAVKEAMYKMEVTADQGAMVGGGIKTAAALLGLSLVSLIVAELYNVFK